MTVHQILMRDMYKSKKLLGWSRISCFRKRLVKDIFKIELGQVEPKQLRRGSARCKEY